MKTLLRIAAACFWLYLTVSVVNLSFRVENVNKVRYNVVVSLKDGVNIAGDLHSNWNGSHTLLEADGTAHNFTDFRAMTIPLERNESSGSPWWGLILMTFWFAFSLVVHLQLDKHFWRRLDRH